MSPRAPSPAARWARTLSRARARSPRGRCSSCCFVRWCWGSAARLSIGRRMHDKGNPIGRLSHPSVERTSPRPEERGLSRSRPVGAGRCRQLRLPAAFPGRAFNGSTAGLGPGCPVLGGPGCMNRGLSAGFGCYCATQGRAQTPRGRLPRCLFNARKAPHMGGRGGRRLVDDAPFRARISRRRPVPLPARGPAPTRRARAWEPRAGAGPWAVLARPVPRPGTPPTRTASAAARRARPGGW